MLKILVPVNGSECALKAVDQAIRDAQEQGNAHIHLLNVQPVLPRHASRFVGTDARRAMREARAAEAMETALRRVRTAGIPCSAHVRIGRIAPSIAAFTRGEAVDRVIMGSRPGKGGLRSLRRPLVDQVIRATDVPVEAVTGGRRGYAERFGLPAGLAGLAMVWLASE